MGTRQPKRAAAATGAASDREAPKRAVTMEMVGRIAGVSQVTVSRALNDPTKVSPATLKKIKDAIAVTGFVPNALAGALASRRSRLISALVPSVTNIVYASMVQSFTDVMREHGYQIMLSETGLDAAEQEERLIEAHLSRRPDAILLTGARHSPNARRMLLAAGAPTVELWDLTSTPIDLCVGFDHEAAGAAAARFLAEAGHKRAASVTAGDERALRRKDAFNETFSALTGAPTATIMVGGAASLGRGRAAVETLIKEHDFRSGAVFCSSDLLAHGALIEARRQGLRTPAEFAVMGFGDQEFARDTDPALTTIRVDRAALGARAAEALVRRLSGEEIAEPVIDIGFEIVRRDSA